MAASKVAVEVTKKELEDICDALEELGLEAASNPTVEEKTVKRINKLFNRLVKLHSNP